MGEVRELRPRTAREGDESAVAIHRYSASLIAEAQASSLEAAARGLEAVDTPTTTGAVAEVLRARATELRDMIR